MRSRAFLVLVFPLIALISPAQTPFQHRDGIALVVVLALPFPFKLCPVTLAFLPWKTMGLKDYFRKVMPKLRHPDGAREGSYEEAAAARIAELTASRRTIAEAFEIERLRIENDLHDGAQQYIVAASMKLGLAELEASGIDNKELQNLLAETRQHLDDGLRALRRTVHGIHPQVLRDRGLQAAVEEIAEGYGPHVVVRAPYPLPELEESVLAAAYFSVRKC